MITSYLTKELEMEWTSNEEEIDLEETIIDDVYRTLSKKTIAWPIDLSECNRLQLIDHLIFHFEGKEEFKKCTVLQKLRKKIEAND